ncbi:Prokaryotic metallothionein [compost metagenome]
MGEAHCACPGCICSLGDEAVYRDDKGYCCQACADQHPKGEHHCSDPTCQCGDPHWRDVE